MNAAEAIRILTAAGHRVTRNSKNAPNYRWAFNYKLDGEDVTLGRLRAAAAAAAAAASVLA